MEANYTKQFPKEGAPDIVRRARARVLDLFNRHADARLVFHNYSLTADIVALAGEIARGENAGPADTEAAQLAAWFLHLGMAIDYDQPLPPALEEAERFLLQEHYPDDQRRDVLQSLRAVRENQPLPSTAARILADAAQIAMYIADFAERTPLLRLEGEFFLNRRLSRDDWQKLQLQYLLQVRLHTHYARTHYEPLLGRLIREQKERIESSSTESGNGSPVSVAPHYFHKLEKKRNPVRATQTFFRTNYRNHINLSSIADNKANIMISVNSILISVLITILTYRNLTETQPMVLLPVVIFLVTGLASLIFAVLSARPKVTALNRQQPNPEEIKKNIVFFGNFVHLDLHEYEAAMDAVFRNDELLYGNMTRDLYHLGKVLDKKYRYLSISYNIFMVGFIATVGTFLFLLFR